MSYLDITIIAIIAGFGLFGLWFGLIHTLGSLVGTFFGLYFATRYYSPMADWLISITGWSGNFAKVFMFILAFVLIARLVGLVFWLAEKLLGWITKLPFIRSLNHLTGAIVGVAEGAVIVGVSIYFIARFPIGEKFMLSLGESVIAPYLVKPVSIMLPLIPDAIKFLQSTVKSII